MNGPYSAENLTRLHARLSEVLASTARLVEEMASPLSLTRSELRESAENLVRYLALRRQDMRALQMELAGLGLSSLGRIESHVHGAIDCVLFVLEQLGATPEGASRPAPAVAPLEAGDALLARHTAALLGPPQRERGNRIMVTLDGAAARDPAFVEALVAAGMDVARVNAAHDDPQAWARMVEHVRRAEQVTGKRCPVLVDLPGPKLRTGPVLDGPRVLRVAHGRDARGRVVRLARARFVRSDVPARPGDVPLSPGLVQLAQAGDELSLKDAPGRPRKFLVCSLEEGAFWAEGRQTAYLEPGLRVRLLRAGSCLAEGEIGDLPATPGTIRLQPGDEAVLCPPGSLGAPATRDAAGRVTSPARIPSSLPQVLAEARPGQRILFDDGKIEGQVLAAEHEGLRFRVTRTAPGGGKLGADKGINLPDTRLSIPALTEDDLTALDFAAVHADLVGLSFVRTAADVDHLRAELDARAVQRLGVVLKVETQEGFANLPDLLLAGLRLPRLGVMVARGDLGVEVGFQRMAEVQEQILWLCEAAHVPVIWATQVLESLNKRGLPSRGDVTDAAMSARAECVMLNKGEHILATIAFLDDILRRMQDHHHKKTPMLRRLKVSEGRWTR